MPPFIQNILALPAKTKAILGVSAFAILAIAFLLLKIATAPAYSTIASGLDPAQTGKITAALDEQGIAYELQNNGTALAVQKASMAQARIALASQGVGTTGGGGSDEGYTLLDQSKLGASQFQQQVTYQRALEGEIGKTLASVQGVSNPQVQVVMPQDDLFQDEASAATASVQLGNTADTLEPGAVRGMAQTVASSVKGLKSANVTITDSTGTILWPSDEAGATGSGTKQAAEARFARQKEAAINAMLAQTLGPNKAKVTVNADLNVDDTTEESETYGGQSTPLTETIESEKMEGANAAGAGGTAGTGRNVPTYSDNGNNGAGAGGNYENKKQTTVNGVNKKVTKTKKAPGEVNKMNVALILDKSVPADVATALKNTVATAAGVDTQRGDTITSTQFAFAKAETPKAGPVPTTLLGPLKWVGLGLAALLFLFFMTRGMRKRENENLTPAWLTEISEPVSLAQLEAGAGQNFTLDNASTAMLPPRAPDASMHQLDQLMEREPERVAAQVKAWMAED
ncbi:flagellar M-ring protein FliF [Solirubrobacter pauli]|uniref:Flagellar M-ring protein n=1 Tax=Solirubrobacter pauli TaxID=166793 RepID=A0A660LCT8_9ACTN|nr:flagellar basal-body MS-ring/collar protein FliF [Solirubrobacter pauli]RKQ92399.1 flagellar M-ring protein FliF [Solirubrobacter pauli]